MNKKYIAIMVLGVASLFACSSKSGGGGEDGDGNPPGVVDPPVDGDSGVVAPPRPDSGTPDSGTPDATVSEPTNQAECIAACEVSHPTAAQMNHDLDNNCFYGGACEASCNNLGQGQNFTPSPAAAAQCDTATANSWPVSTPSLNCSDCIATTPACCNLWIGIFGSAEGQSLSHCAHDCWDRFPN